MTLHSSRRRGHQICHQTDHLVYWFNWYNTTIEITILHWHAQCDESEEYVTFVFLWERQLKTFCCWECRGQWKAEKDTRRHFPPLSVLLLLGIGSWLTFTSTCTIFQGKCFPSKGDVFLSWSLRSNSRAITFQLKGFWEEKRPWTDR